MQRVGDTLECLVVALGFYPAYYAGTWIAALRAGWRLGSQRTALLAPGEGAAA